MICWNDPVNLMTYVTHVFQKVFGNLDQAFARRDEGQRSGNDERDRREKDRDHIGERVRIAQSQVGYMDAGRHLDRCEEQ